MKAEIKEYVELEKRQKEIREQFSLEDNIYLFYVLTDEGLEL